MGFATSGGAYGHDPSKVGQPPVPAQYLAFDVLLEDGRTQLFWHHELVEIAERAAHGKR